MDLPPAVRVVAIVVAAAAAMDQAGAARRASAFAATAAASTRIDKRTTTIDPPHSPHSPHSPPNSHFKAFGDYIDEVLRMGKGLKVPKFGNFTCVKNSTRDTVPGIKGFTFW